MNIPQEWLTGISFVSATLGILRFMWSLGKGGLKDGESPHAKDKYERPKAWKKPELRAKCMVTVRGLQHTRGCRIYIAGLDPNGDKRELMNTVIAPNVHVLTTEIYDYERALVRVRGTEWIPFEAESSTPGSFDVQVDMAKDVLPNSNKITGFATGGLIDSYPMLGEMRGPEALIPMTALNGIKPLSPVVRLKAARVGMAKSEESTFGVSQYDIALGHGQEIRKSRQKAKTVITDLQTELIVTNDGVQHRIPVKVKDFKMEVNNTVPYAEALEDGVLKIGEETKKLDWHKVGIDYAKTMGTFGMSVKEAGLAISEAMHKE